MRKTRIKTMANIVKIAKLVADNQSNKINNMVNNNNKANIDSTNINLVKFSIQNNILLVDSIKKTCCK